MLLMWVVNVSWQSIRWRRTRHKLDLRRVASESVPVRPQEMKVGDPLTIVAPTSRLNVLGLSGLLAVDTLCPSRLSVKSLYPLAGYLEG